jgi:transcriptional regulator with XRE-family HTH domain
METIYQRIRAVRKEARLSQQEFAEALEISQSYVSSLEQGGREASRNVIDKLMERFGVSPSWLHTGQGPARLDAMNSNKVQGVFSALSPHSVINAVVAPEPRAAPVTPMEGPQLDQWLSGQGERLLTVTVDSRNDPAIALVPVKAQAGYARHRVEPVFMQELPVLQLPDNRFRFGTYRAFEINGDSMEPTLFGTDVVVCRYVEDWRWLRDHELYVVVLKEDVLVKRVRNRIQHQQRVDLMSDNQFYPVFTVPVTEIVEVWQVSARLTTHLPAPPYGSMQRADA